MFSLYLHHILKDEAPNACSVRWLISIDLLMFKSIDVFCFVSLHVCICFQGDIGHDLFSLLDEPCLLGDNSPDLFDQTFTLNTPNTESILSSLTDNDKVLAQESTTSQPANHEIDHDYTPHRPPTRNSVSGLSDSGISSDCGQFSPQQAPSPGYNSDNGQISPSINSNQNSPLGGGIEDMDINQCLLQGEDLDLFNILTTDTNVSINVGELHVLCFCLLPIFSKWQEVLKLPVLPYLSPSPPVFCLISQLVLKLACFN